MRRIIPNGNVAGLLYVSCELKCVCSRHGDRNFQVEFTNGRDLLFDYLEAPRSQQILATQRRWQTGSNKSRSRSLENDAGPVERLQRACHSHGKVF